MMLARQTMRSFRRATLLLFSAAMLLLTAAPSQAQNAELPVLSLETKIVLGDVSGRIDHMAFDPARNRLFVAELENNSLGVVDLNERKVVHEITGLAEPQGVAYEPASDTLYVANGGDGSVRLYRGADYAETGRIALGDDADNIRIHPGTGHILVGYGAGAIATINPATRARSPIFPCRSSGELSARSQDQPSVRERATCEDDRGARQRERSTEGYLVCEGGWRELSDGAR
jgi:YVTN family beta-propeller protein